MKDGLRSHIGAGKPACSRIAVHGCVYKDRYQHAHNGCDRAPDTDGQQPIAGREETPSKNERHSAYECLD